MNAGPALALLEQSRQCLAQAYAAELAAVRLVTSQDAAMRAAAALVAGRGTRGPQDLWPLLATQSPELAEWAEVFDGTDACVAPVVPLVEAPHHPHLAARHTFVERDGVTQPAPAPRFSRTAPTLDAPPALPGEHTREALTAWGIDDVEALLDSGAAVQA